MKEIKIGNRVRVIDAPCPEWMQNMPALPDTIFKVEGTQNDKLILSVKGSNAVFICDAKHFELVESSDPKTAFLSELQGLLRKYDAKIHVWAGYNGDKVLIFELKDNNDIVYPNEWLNDYKFVFPITPDNIFNYDKE